MTAGGVAVRRADEDGVHVGGDDCLRTVGHVGVGEFGGEGGRVWVVAAHNGGVVAPGQFAGADHFHLAEADKADFHEFAHSGNSICGSGNVRGDAPPAGMA